MIALIIIGCVLLFASLIWAMMAYERNHDSWVVAYFIFALGMLLLVVGAMEFTKKDTEIGCLNGKFTYEQQLVYRLNDTIPVDTIYVKIK